MRISRPRGRGPLIGQRFVVPHYLRPTPNQWPKNLRSEDLPTLILYSGFGVRLGNRFSENENENEHSELVKANKNRNRNMVTNIGG